jgi:thioredoxin reductase (NADPH)
VVLRQGREFSHRIVAPSCAHPALTLYPPPFSPLPPLSQFLGGCDATLAWIRANYMGGSSASRAPRVLHSSDARVPGDGAGYDFDLVVIGGGSGGLACSKEAAELGAKVAVLDFVKPSWQGSTWGLGGTCVNVGCIPKKLMHQAALLGESLKDAEAFGWKQGGAGQAAEAPAGATHSWETMVSSVQDHIASLNFGYRVALREKSVDYKNALGAFVDPHTLELTDKKGKKSTITARRFVVAVGGRPKPLDIPGGELAISSDDIFSLAKAPGKTLVVGASYVALECAGFLAGLGYETAVMVRSVLLRGFDQQIADKIGDHMGEHGVRFIRPATPTKIEKLEGSGKLKVTFVNADTNVESTEEFDTVFTATGRYADTPKLNAAAAGIKTDRDGKIPCVAEQSNVPHIYAIGDVVTGAPELTPVAIAAGRLLARRIYGGKTEGMDYDKVPTTVFTPLEYGAIGLSEEAALSRFGEENVEIFHSSFTPLEWSVVSTRPSNACYAKLIVHKADGNRVVGFHILGPHAGEVTQGWAAAMKLGATYETFTQTVGIHPTVAEEFTTLSITKSSGESADKGGC